MEPDGPKLVKGLNVHLIVPGKCTKCKSEKDGIAEIYTPMETESSVNSVTQTNSKSGGKKSKSHAQRCPHCYLKVLRKEQIRNIRDSEKKKKLGDDIGGVELLILQKQVQWRGSVDVIVGQDTKLAKPFELTKEKRREMFDIYYGSPDFENDMMGYPPLRIPIKAFPSAEYKEAVFPSFNAGLDQALEKLEIKERGSGFGLAMEDHGFGNSDEGTVPQS